MRTPIEPGDIRKGDLIRVEWLASETAEEWRAHLARNAPYRPEVVRYYLLDRPTPPVELPSEPTLGWIRSTSSGATDLDFWRYRPTTDRAGEGVWAGNDKDGCPRGYAFSNITAFTPATAVPTEALDELRAAWFNADPKIHDRVNDFLDTIDEATA